MLGYGGRPEHAPGGEVQATELQLVSTMVQLAFNIVIVRVGCRRPCSAEVAVGWSWLPTGSGRSQLELVARSGWRNCRLFAVIPGYVEFFPKMHFTRLGVLAIKMIGSAGRALSRGDLL